MGCHKSHPLNFKGGFDLQLGDGLDRCRGSAGLDADVLNGAAVRADEACKRLGGERAAVNVDRDQLRRRQCLTGECKRSLDGRKPTARLQRRLDRLQIVGVRPDRRGELVQ